MKHKLAALAILALGFAGCHAQVPPASAGYEVVLTATAPVASGNWAGCGTGQPQCTYAFYGETITGTTCDPSTSTNYKEITTPTARPTTSNFIDQNTTGLTKCYDVETVQSGGNSAPSVVAGPVVSPGIPVAPTLAPPVSQVATLEKPALGIPAASQQFTMNIPPMIMTVRIVRTR
jgi:hypothetical protein